MPSPELIDAWWAALPQKRRDQVFDWLADKDDVPDEHPHIDGQTDLLDELKDRP
jgi:hypothetical protein